MTDPPSGPRSGPPPDRASSPSDLTDRGDALTRRLREARKLELGTARKEPDLNSEASGLGQAFRIGAEMISALLVGVGIGWGLDTLLGTKPWMMVIFIFLGGAAGILNVYHTAMRMAEDLSDDLKENSTKSDAFDGTNAPHGSPLDPNDQKK